MKIAVCYSGQIGAIHKACGFQRASFLRDDMDIYAFTSDLISQKGNSNPNYKPVSSVHKYLPKGKGWRSNLGDYGIIYRISDEDIKRNLSVLKPNLVKAVVDREDLDDSLEDWDMTKWEWLTQITTMSTQNIARGNLSLTTALRDLELHAWYTAMHL